MPHWMYDHMGWGAVSMALAVLFWIALIAIVAVGLMRWLQQGPATFQASEPREDAALAILRERYARGELSREEYERMRDELTR